MKIAGVIAEYNPFHSGHAYHLRKTREATGCDFVVVCMAGSYVQRGEAACLSKWDRARMALLCGADAVFELPTLFAVRTADVFARGGVGVLDGLGVDALSFGSESADLAFLKRLSRLREQEPPEVSRDVQSALREGKSHARAQGEAWAKALNVDPEAIHAPNAILGAEYLRALRALHSPTEPFAIARIGDYHNPKAQGRFASATAIRQALWEGRKEEALSFVPPPAAEILRAAGTMHAPDDLLLARLRAMTEAEIAALPDVSEGLERRVKRCAAEAASAEALLDALKCKRYTRARLSRLTAHALLGLTARLSEKHPRVEYARLLGMRNDARPLLKELKQRAQIPIVSGGSQIADHEVFHLECRATDLRALQCDRPEERRAGQELTQKFVLV